jgi:TolB protein
VRWLCRSLFALTLAAAASAQDRPVTEVGSGAFKLENVAVQRFLARSPEAQSLATELTSALGGGLEFSMLYALEPESAFLDPVTSPALGSERAPKCANWKQIGADYLVQGEAAVTADALRVTYRVWDVVKCSAKVASKQRTARPENARRLGKSIADEIVGALTGVPGVADTEMAYVSSRIGSKEVFVMDANGDNQRAATNWGTISIFPSWAPDASGLVLTTYRYRSRPWLFALKRNGQPSGRLFQSLPDSTRLYRGVYDPSGTRLAIVGSVDGVSEIFTATNGGGLKRLTKDRYIDVGPTWSPDGRQIAFVSDRTGAPQIYVMDAEGKAVRRVTFDGSYNTSPAWSPDGEWIAFETRINSQFDIWKIRPSGGPSIPMISHPRSDEHPSWSPDGRLLAFSSTRYGRADIYVVSSGGEGAKLPPALRITNRGDNTNPAWGPRRAR